MDAFRDLLGAVYLVDAAGHEWFAESGTELAGCLAIEDLPKVPDGVLGKKVDHHNVVS